MRLRVLCYGAITSLIIGAVQSSIYELLVAKAGLNPWLTLAIVIVGTILIIASYFIVLDRELALDSFLYGVLGFGFPGMYMNMLRGDLDPDELSWTESLLSLTPIFFGAFFISSLFKMDLTGRAVTVFIVWSLALVVAIALGVRSRQPSVSGGI